MQEIGAERTAEELEAELAGIGRLVEEAAVDEDVIEFNRLVMLERALPRLIREARLAPLRERLARVEDELDGLVEQRERAMVEEPPPAPASMRGTVTVHMRRQRILDGLAARERQASEDRRRLLSAISEIEGG